MKSHNEKMSLSTLLLTMFLLAFVPIRIVKADPPSLSPSVPTQSISPGASADVHLPISKTEFDRTVQAGDLIQHRTVPAAWIVEALKRNPVKRRRDSHNIQLLLDNCIVEEPLSVSGKAILHIRGEVSITSSTFLNLVNFKGVKFSNFLLFTKTVFKHGLEFSEVATDNHSTNFDYTIFGNADEGWITWFTDVIFKGHTSFVSTKFKGNLRLARVTFQNEAVFSNNISSEGGSEFDDTDFDHVSFQKSRFDGARFRAYLGFADCTFVDTSNFSFAYFEGPVSFENSNFKGVIAFTNANFVSEPDNDENLTLAQFVHASFDKTALFRDLQMLGFEMYFSDCTFKGDMFMDGINGIPQKGKMEPKHKRGNLSFSETAINGRAYFDRSRFNALAISTRSLKGDINQRISSPSTFAKQATFRMIECDDGDFSDAEFQGIADFTAAKFYRSVRFVSTTFNGDVGFSDVRFPSPFVEGSAKRLASHGVFMDDVLFGKNLRLSWRLAETGQWWNPFDEPRTKLVTTQAATWDALQQAYVRSSNLEGQNEALYQKRLISLNDPSTNDDEWRLSNWFSRKFWGYGVRPSRIAFWMVLLFCLFTWIYSRGQVRIETRYNYSTLCPDDIIQPQALCRKLVERQNALAVWLQIRLSLTMRQLIMYGNELDEAKPTICAALADSINAALALEKITAEQYADLPLNRWTRWRLNSNLKNPALLRLNRKVFCCAFKDEVRFRKGRALLRSSWLQRLTAALDFSRRTSLTVGYGFQNARNTPIKIVAFIHSVVFKILILFFIQSIANTIPLLKELVGKFLPT